MKLKTNITAIVLSILISSSAYAKTKDSINIGDLARVVDPGIGAQFQISNLKGDLGRLQKLDSARAKYLLLRINELEGMVERSRDLFGLKLRLSEDIAPARLFSEGSILFKNDNCEISASVPSYPREGRLSRLNRRYLGIPFSEFHSGYQKESGVFKYAGKFTPDEHPNLKTFKFKSSQYEGPEGSVEVVCIGSELTNSSTLTELENMLDNKIILEVR